jgi:hypothetical protein
MAVKSLLTMCPEVVKLNHCSCCCQTGHNGRAHLAEFSLELIRVYRGQLWKGKTQWMFLLKIILRNINGVELSITKK